MRKLGYDIAGFSPLTHPLARRQQILESSNVDTVLDVGANIGQFARHLRQDAGYRRRILSFEPLPEAFRILAANAQRDPAWEAFNYAIGDTNEFLEINISGNSHSSSLREILPAHVNSEPRSGYVGKETVQVRTLDSVFPEMCGTSGSVYLKIDTQGFEDKVLKGATDSLPFIGVVQLEMSLVPLYAGEQLFPEMCPRMRELGYSLVGIETGFSDRESGNVLQVDGTFRRA